MMSLRHVFCLLRLKKEICCFSLNDWFHGFHGIHGFDWFHGFYGIHGFHGIQRHRI